MNTKEAEEFQGQNISPRWETRRSYHVVNGQDSAKLSANVSSMLNSGWELYGSPMFSVGIPYVEDRYMQAVVKEEVIKHI
jgi:hypothetical protein